MNIKQSPYGYLKQRACVYKDNQNVPFSLEEYFGDSSLINEDDDDVFKEKMLTFMRERRRDKWEFIINRVMENGGVVLSKPDKRTLDKTNIEDLEIILEILDKNYGTEKIGDFSFQEFREGFQNKLDRLNLKEALE